MATSVLGAAFERVKRFIRQPSTHDTIMRCLLWSYNPQSMLVLPAITRENLTYTKELLQFPPSPTESALSLPSARFMFPSGSVFGSPKGPAYEQLADAKDLETLEKSNIIFPDELVLEKDKYGRHVELGHGVYATVIAGRYQGMNVAVKVFHENMTFVSKIAHEMKVLRRLRHTEGSARLIGVLPANAQRLSPLPALVMRAAEGNTLSAFLMEGHSLSRLQWLKLCQSIGKAVFEMHHKHILHNDLKTDNIMVTQERDEFRATIIDFGEASIDQGRKYAIPKSQEGQFFHIAPEVVDGELTSYQSDIFSLGIVFRPILLRQGLEKVLIYLVSSCTSTVRKDRHDADLVVRMLHGLIGLAEMHGNGRIPVGDIVEVYASCTDSGDDHSCISQ